MSPELLQDFMDGYHGVLNKLYSIKFIEYAMMGI